MTQELAALVRELESSRYKKSGWPIQASRFSKHQLITYFFFNPSSISRSFKNSPAVMSASFFGLSAVTK